MLKAHSGLGDSSKKDELVASVSHELGSPLTAVVDLFGHVQPAGNPDRREPTITNLTFRAQTGCGGR